MSTPSYDNDLLGMSAYQLGPYGPRTTKQSHFERWIHSPPSDNELWVLIGALTTSFAGAAYGTYRFIKYLRR